LYKPYIFIVGYNLKTLIKVAAKDVQKQVTVVLLMQFCLFLRKGVNVC